MTTEPEAAPMSRMNTLWLRMTEIYGHKWTSAYGEDPAKGAGGTWAKGLASISPRQLADGLSAALASADPWPPTLPEFRRLCLSIPTFGAVQYELRNGKGVRSQFLRQTFNYLDAYLFARADEQRAERMLREAYDLAVDYAMRGGPLPHPLSGEIAAPVAEPHIPANPETAAAHLDAIAEILGEGKSEEDASDRHSPKGAHVREDLGA